MGYEDAVRLALLRIGTGQVLTSWTDAHSSFGEMPQPVKLSSAEGMLIEKRQIIVDTDLTTIFKLISCFGGEEGWLYASYLWRLRGMLDKLFGGIGLMRGRRCPINVRVGDALGFWRVEAVEDNRLLRLRSEMKMKSRAWLQFEVEQTEDNQVLDRRAHV